MPTATQTPPNPRHSGDDAPGVSVVIATVDREQMLLRAIRAVLDQDYLGPVEVVVVRDGTHTREAVSRLTDELGELGVGRSLIQIPNSRSKGLPGGRNSGILAAMHPLVAFCDDDDEWLPGKLSAQVPILVRTASASMIATGISVVTDGVENPRPGPLRPTTLEDLITRRVMELHPSTFLFRRDDLLGGTIGLVDEEIPGGYAEDYDMLLRAAEVGPILSVPRPLVRVHWHGSSYYFSKWEMIHDALDMLLVKHPQFSSIPAGQARILGQQAIALAAMGRRREAFGAALSTMRLHPGEPRALIAAAVASGAVSVEAIQKVLHRRGRGL